MQEYVAFVGSDTEHDNKVSHRVFFSLPRHKIYAETILLSIKYEIELVF
jgi:hypothetical protein